MLAGCNGAGDGFSGVSESEVKPGDSNAISVAAKIEDYFPKDDPVIFLTNTEKTFAVDVSQGSGDVTYQFILDGVVRQDSRSAYLILEASELGAGIHTLKAIASNELGSDIHEFSLIKNRVPVVAFDSETNTNINCGSESYTLNVTASDQDGDNLTFKFYLNGIENHSSLTTTNGASSASVTFSPNCTLNGSQVVRVTAIDSKGEESSYNSTVTVLNPNAAVITSYLPLSNPTLVGSVETVNFIVSASGNAPLQYRWDINPGSTIGSCNSLATCPISGTDFTPGRYSLTATVTDALNTTDDRMYTVVLNQKPQIAATPSNVAKIKMNCGSSKSFSLSVNDANFGDSTQNFTVQWLLDGNAHNSIAVTNSLGSVPMESDATFSPNCNALLLGDHTITANFSDGHETSSVSWSVNVNYFNDSCNNLSAGQICTALGFLGMGSGLYSTTNASEIRLQPEFIEPRSSGGYFISDINWNVVWFYNDTSNTINILGQDVYAKQLKVVVGVGAAGDGVNGSASGFYLESPRDLAYDNTNGDLYISDYSNNRIVKVSSTGMATHFAGGGSSNDDGDTRIDHECRGPVGLELDEGDDKLFVACFGVNSSDVDGSIKYFSLTSDIGHTLARYKNNGNTEGSLGYNGTARLRKTYSIAKHPTKKILFAGDMDKCQIMALSYGGTESFYNGAISLASNEMKVLTLGTSCGNTINRVYSDTSLRIRTHSIAPYSSGGVFRGLFISNYNEHVIYFLNLAATDVEYGGKVVESTMVRNVYGTGAADYSRNEPASSASYLRNPIGVTIKSDYLLIADRLNYRVAKLNIAAANGDSSDDLGSVFLNDYDGDLDKNTNLRQLYNPSALTYDLTHNDLLVLDTSNRRIRRLDLDTGSFKLVLGNGYGNANTDPELPVDAQMMTPRDITTTFNDDLLIYSDSNGTGANRNCVVRGLNNSQSDRDFFGLNIPEGKILTLAGNYTIGCQFWNSLYEGDTAIDTAIHDPFGLVSLRDQSGLFIASRSNHCILRVNEDGEINTEVGSCGSSGSLNGAIADAKLDSPGDMELDSDSTYREYGNFFVVDRSITSGSKIRYVNYSPATVTINSIDISNNEIQTVITTDGYVGGVASFEDQICYTQGAGGVASTVPSNVECLNRITGSTTLRVGKPSASAIKGASPLYNEEEGILATSSKLNRPWGITFDSEGNLYISDYMSNNIRMVKRWY